MMIYSGGIIVLLWVFFWILEYLTAKKEAVAASKLLKSTIGVYSSIGKFRTAYSVINHYPCLQYRDVRYNMSSQGRAEGSKLTVQNFLALSEEL